MNLWLTLLLACLLTGQVQAQNLVPNGSFEVMPQAVASPGAIHRAPPWRAASATGPDLLHKYAADRQLWPPYAGQYEDSYQHPRTGKGMAALRVQSADPNRLQILQVPLKQPLRSGQHYYVELYVSPDVSRRHPQHSPERLDLAFTEQPTDAARVEDSPIQRFLRHTGPAFREVEGWYRLCAHYIAVGGEQYLLIGNLQGELAEEDRYLFIDDVRVTATSDMLPDTLGFCPGLRLELQNPPAHTRYRWSGGITTPIIAAQHPGLYTVALDFGYCQYVDTVYVQAGIATTEDCGCQFYVPDAFSPNDDYQNDRLQVYTGCPRRYRIHQFRIYDRYGSAVYSNSGENPIAWDGKFRGLRVPAGAYRWVLHYSIPTESGRLRRTEWGTLVLVR